jgi:hypothetical protein
VLIALLLVVTACWIVVGRLDVMRMSGTAPVTVVSARLQTATGGKEQAPSGFWIRYTYTVGATTYAGEEFERWSNVDAHKPHVCFDPGEPSRHRLVSGEVVCGA